MNPVPLHIFERILHPFGQSSVSWWRHDMETYSALPAEGKTPVTCELSALRASNAEFRCWADVHLYKLSSGWVIETLWCLCYVTIMLHFAAMSAGVLDPPCITSPWWRHQMELFSALLAICAGNSPFYGEFPAQRPVTRSFDVFFDMHPNKQLSKQTWGWWFETPSWSWRHLCWIHHV